jgi:integrase
MPFGDSGADCAMSPTEWLGAGGVPLETGMRQDEVRGFEWSQVWIQRRKIRLNKTKTSSPRVVPLRDTSLGTLIGTPRHITSPRVFWHGTGDRYTCFADDFARSPAERGLPFRCHVLRHRFAFLFAQETGDLHAHQAVLDRKTIAHGDALLAPDRASDRVMNENVALAGTSAADLTGSID